jgi:hypothetical protein
MQTTSRYLASVIVASFAAIAALAAHTAAPAPSAAVRFELSFPASARATATDGRMYVILSKDASSEPRLQIQGYSGEAPFFGQNVDGLKPGQWVALDAAADGYPYLQLKDLPAGDYTVQGLLSLYTTFHRADGHVVKMHMDQWEGQQFPISPGNLYSTPQPIHLTAGTSPQTIRLTLDHVIPPIAVPPDTEYVKHVKFQSPLLSRFWGQPIFIGATILLPKGYDANPTTRYPVNYEQGHFSRSAPGGFGEAIELPANATDRQRARASARQAFDAAWTSDDFPRMIYVTFQHPTPYYDDSYAVDSPNVGPYGQAITKELIPYIDAHFRTIAQPWARVVSGGSTGGWESLALQIFHPEFFGGTYSYCPDPVDFHGFQIVNIYDWPNAWFRHDGGITVPLPGMRDTHGVVLNTMQQEMNYERARGDKGRSGEQWDVWEAVYGPLGDDGYFKPLIDPETGAIDKSVAAYWRDHMDLKHYLETHWSTVGPQLAGKLHIWVGDMDTYYLNNAVHILDDYLSTTTNPPYGGSITYGAYQPHCWAGPQPLADRLRGMAADMAKSKAIGR